MNAEFIARATEVHGGRYDYSKVSYRYAREKVEIVCPEHGSFWQAPHKHIHAKHGCPACKPTARVTEAAFVARVREVHGDSLSVAPGTFTKMFARVKMVCEKHGVFEPLASNVVNNRSGCPKCAAELRGVQQRLTKGVFVARAEQVHGNRYGYEEAVVSDSTTPITIVCSTHGPFQQSPAKHLTGHGCPVCGVEKRTSGITKSREQFVLDAVAVHGDSYDYSRFEYSQARSAGMIVCRKHGPFEQTPDAHLAGKGCPRCTSQVSKWEAEVADFLRESGITCERTRKVAGVEFDLYAEGVAIECNGLYWHSDRFTNARMRHLEKTRAARAAGVRLLHIFEDEWVYRRKAVENLLLSAFGKAARIYARDCSMGVSSSREVAGFLEAHHIQGSATGSVVYTLHHTGSVVATMVFSKVRSERGAKDAGWELVRYASSGVVVGGASRLFSRFLEDVHPARVISYSDNRLFAGGVYEKLGFAKVHETAPQYRVVFRGRRLHKANFKKRALARLVGQGAVDGKTEREVCESLGLSRIYDCGLTKWEYVVYS